MIKKILLVDPHWIHPEISMPHLGLAYLASVLAKQGFEVSVEGFVPTRPKAAFYKINNIDDFFKREAEFCSQIANKALDYDVLGVTSTSGTYQRALRLIEKAKIANPSILTILGGPHPTLMESSSRWTGKIFSDCGELDIVVKGEGEEAILNLCQNYPDIRAIPNLLFRSRDEIISTPNEPVRQPLSQIPMADWSLFHYHNFSRIFPVITARGCIFSCLFCDESKIFHGFRYRPVSDVVSELDKNIHLYGVKAFWFSDSSLTSNPKLPEICDEITQRKIPIRWSSFARVDQVNDSILEKMKESGCLLLYFGIESGSNKILKQMKKGFTTKQIRDGIKLCKKHGILSDGSFIIGFPGETRDSAIETIELAKELDCTLYSWHVFTPSFYMTDRSSKFHLNIPEDFDWKHYSIDLPEGVMFKSSRQERFYDRHLAADEVLQGLEPSRTDIVLHDTLTYDTAAELVKIAIRETKMTGDLDDLRLLLEDYN